ncbi:MAG: hypothetical protein OK442_06935 [Thaumarchaeota archaeon]|nr:hypothetical protein [Nitrososphaerota archaeon]
MTATPPPATTAEELELMRSLRAVLKRSSRGLGLAAAFVGVFSDSKDGAERGAVKRILLGTPVEMAIAGLVKESGSSGELLQFIATLAKVSSAEASRGAEKLSSMFDRWTLLKEKRAMEKKVMAFRGLIVSVVAGVVVGMLSTLAPVISTFQITLGTAPQAASGFSPYEGAAFLLPSAICLGLFLSPQRPYVNVAVSLVAFAGVVYFLGPLASFSLGA